MVTNSLLMIALIINYYKLEYFSRIEESASEIFRVGCSYSYKISIKDLKLKLLKLGLNKKKLYLNAYAKLNRSYLKGVNGLFASVCLMDQSLFFKSKTKKRFLT